MEVEGNILPVDLRIEEIAVREIAKIQSKNIAEPVKQQLEEYLSRDDYMNKNHHLGRQSTKQ
jgi:virulence-associated protein VagC